jgi:hypothetical protein
MTKTLHTYLPGPSLKHYRIFCWKVGYTHDTSLSLLLAQEGKQSSFSATATVYLRGLNIRSGVKESFY